MKKKIRYKDKEGNEFYYHTLGSFLEKNKEFEQHQKAIKSYIHKKKGGGAKIWGVKMGIEIESVTLEVVTCAVTANGNIPIL